MSSYAELYRQKLTTPSQAVKVIESGDKLFHGLAIAEPPALLAAAAARIREAELKRISVYSLLPLRHAAQTILAPDLCDAVQPYSFFLSGNDRALVRVGLNYYVPGYYHQIPRLITEFIGVDVMVTTVSPMDKAGYFTFGTVNDYTSTAARRAKHLIVEVNQNMPRVFGDSLIHVSEVDAIVENHVPLMEIPAGDTGPADEAIGRIVACMIPDGATIQLGFGSLPNAVGSLLAGHKDLGIHTEVFTSSMVDLIKKGIVNGRKKTLHPGKNVFTGAVGTKDMYDFMNDNPSMESYPVSYTNDPAVIARNDDMISVNSILEVDLLGQCNAEYLDGSQFSGTGGQLDFVRGAFNARGGKSILAFHATAKKGTISRIVPRFDPGTVITTPRMDTHYLVTEHGAVNLKGKSTRERALDIISIAHPQFRDELLREAENMYLI
ncbi:MAG: 4-hydroxybutyrate--acetyl-CoA CoA transferase [Deltaproteobacteria bacterium]